MNYQIRHAQTEDLLKLADIAIACAELFPEEDLPRWFRSETTPVHILQKAVEDNRLWVAVISPDHLAGFALVTLENGKPHLKELGVHPDYGRNGIGTALVNTVIQWAKSQKHPSVSLTTFRHLPFNAPFYERLGFTMLDSSNLNEHLFKLLHEEANHLDIHKRVLMLLDLEF